MIDPFQSIDYYQTDLEFPKWPSPSERKQFQQAFAEFKIFQSYSIKPELKQRLVEQLYIEHFQFWKQTTKHYLIFQKVKQAENEHNISKRVQT